MSHPRLIRCAASLIALLAWPECHAAAVERPNILWITCEDMSPNLGCYGDAYAVTPQLDRLAQESVRFTHAFAPIGVCAPARSCLITGMYPPSIGTQHMRCRGILPDQVNCFPQYLREAGYYCTNNVKTDYNFTQPMETWDESSNKAHWRNRPPDRPFFAVINLTTTHESQIRLPQKQSEQRTRDFTEQERHDPALAPLPPYHPDTPAVRNDWARYYDRITLMDRQAGEILRQLETDGLAEDTIVFFFSDHGAGMPRSKRWLYDSSTRVPLIVRFPAKYRHLAPGDPGSASDRLVSFVDFGATVLSLAGVPVPEHMQGTAFLGEQAAEPRQYVYGFRDRMDERYDLLRSVRDGRYKYIRNYLPHLPWFHHQHISYMYEMPTMRDWQRLADEGKLDGAAAQFMAESKPVEELYDCEADPHEIHNLAGAPEHQKTLDRLRAAHRNWMLEIRDLGLLPEAMLRARFRGSPYDAVRLNPESYPLETIAATADLASVGTPDELIRTLDAEEPAVRWWATIGLGAGGEPAATSAGLLLETLSDSDPSVRVAAADALCRLGRPAEAVPVLTQALQNESEWVRLAAINVLDRIDEAARPAREAIAQARSDKNEYVVRVAQHAMEFFEKTANAAP